jgi:hypothetical protein
LNPPTGSQSNSPASSGDYSAPSSCESVPGSTSDESNRSSANLDFMLGDMLILPDAATSGAGTMVRFHRACLFDSCHY